MGAPRTSIALLVCGLPLMAWMGSCGSGDNNALPFAPASFDHMPDPAMTGPFTVGVQTWMVTDALRPDTQTGAPRQISLEVWYPARSADGTTRTYVLRDEARAAGVPAGQADGISLSHQILTTAIANAPGHGEHAPYPVVILSHGAYGLRFIHATVAIHIASHGYVVVAPEYPGSRLWDGLATGFDTIPMIASAMLRPTDASFVLDQVAAAGTAGSGHFLEGLVDMTHVGAVGHSLGGSTTVALPCVDERVDAIVLLAPVIAIAQSFGLHYQDFPVPVVGVGGTLDHVVPMSTQYCELRKMQAPSLSYVQIAGAAHLSFTDLCAFDWAKMFEDGLGFGVLDPREEGCVDTFVPSERVQAIAARYATALLNGVLRGSTASLDVLAPGQPEADVTVLSQPLDPWPEGCPP